MVKQVDFFARHRGGLGVFGQGRRWLCITIYCAWVGSMIETTQSVTMSALSCELGVGTGLSTEVRCSIGCRCHSSLAPFVFPRFWAGTSLQSWLVAPTILLVRARGLSTRHRINWTHRIRWQTDLALCHQAVEFVELVASLSFVYLELRGSCVLLV